MATPRTWVRGQWKAICDRCGFEFLNSQLSLEPKTKLRVCRRCLDPFPPQERPIRARERGPLPWTRPEARDRYITEGFYLQDEDGVTWFLSADDDVNLTAEIATSPRPAFRYLILNNAWALSISTTGEPTVSPIADVVGALSMSPNLDALSVSNSLGDTYSLTINDDGGISL